MKKSIVIIFALIFNISYAQNYQDVLRYSQETTMGNARFAAMAGSFGAIGANTSAMSINPAGSAIFKNDVLEFTPGLFLTKTQNYYKGNYDAVYRGRVSIPNMGLVCSKKIEESFAKSVSFGFIINTKNNFNETSFFSAINNSSSLTDDFLRLDNAGFNSESYSDLAYNAFLYDYNEDAGMYQSDFRWYDKDGNEFTQYGQQQDVNIQKLGYVKEYAFNVGVNLGEIVFIGADVNVSEVNYSERTRITEQDANDDFPFLDEFTYKTGLDVKGAGVGAKAGVIVQPIEFLRLGIAGHTPTAFSLSEQYSASIDAHYDVPIDGKEFSKYSDNKSHFDYSVWKPGKIVASAGFIFKNIAIVNVDYERINYANGRLLSNDYSFSDENNEVKDVLRNANNLKFGAELRYGPVSLRGGYSIFGSPYMDYSLSSKIYRQDYSIGLGFTGKVFYCDLAWVKSKKEDGITLYQDFYGDNVNATTKTFTDNAYITLGFKF